MRKIIITKANGQKAPFDPRKVEFTCMRAGADPSVARDIARQIQSRIRHGTTTKEIYAMVLQLLSKRGSVAIKQRYRLKESIMRLGPAGFSFETYVGQILENFGYKTKSIGREFQGRCVKHEIDLAMEQLGKRWLVECKYHSMPGKYTGIKESLYTHARFLDLVDSFDGEMLVCNTKVSDDVITYSSCIGQRILSWRYPVGAGLEKMIEDKKLYPVTILGPTRFELEAFVKSKMMIAKDLVAVDSAEFSRAAGIPLRRVLALQRLSSKIIS
ncbi:MAG TPA: ATP cone domain-containing protein [Candidatus Nitrosotenuis sp.]|nr:ATP cone domain-containing protein [Candidatus Nitrosotenuis sp.]